MALRNEIETAIKDALRAHDQTSLRTLRMALAAIKNAEVGRDGALDDTAVQSILQKEIKSRQESVEEAERAGRKDLSESTRQEITVLEKYLPKQMTDEELDALVHQAIRETAASGANDMGKVMKHVLGQAQGKAPGNRVNSAVRKLLGL